MCNISTRMSLTPLWRSTLANRLDNNRSLIYLASGQSPEWPPAQFSFPDGDSAVSAVYQCFLHVKLNHVACLDAAILKKNLSPICVFQTWLLFFVILQKNMFLPLWCLSLQIVLINVPRFWDIYIANVSCCFNIMDMELELLMSFSNVIFPWFEHQNESSINLHCIRAEAEISETDILKPYHRKPKLSWVASRKTCLL